MNYPPFLVKGFTLDNQEPFVTKLMVVLEEHLVDIDEYVIAYLKQGDAIIFRLIFTHRLFGTGWINTSASQAILGSDIAVDFVTDSILATLNQLVKDREIDCVRN